MGRCTRTAAAYALAAIGLVGCGSADEEDDGLSAACAPQFEYRGHAYVGTAVKVAANEGGPLGTVSAPACHDTPGSPQQEGPREIALAEIEGVSPDVAIMQRGVREAVLIRDDADHRRLPAELARLLRAPECQRTDEPITLSGPWLGILGADGHTELDLAPPYDIRMHVEKTSSERYASAFLTVRVPRAAGRPLARSDIESSLWQDGKISARLTCRGGRFTADQLRAFPN